MNLLNPLIRLRSVFEGVELGQVQTVSLFAHKSRCIAQVVHKCNLYQDLGFRSILREHLLPTYSALPEILIGNLDETC